MKNKLYTMIRYMLLFLALSTFFIACTPAQNDTDKLGAGLDLSNMDTSVRVQDNLFHFVNGNWLKNTMIPADKGRWGAFSELRRNNKRTMLQLLTGTLENGSADQIKVVDFYTVGMDSLLAEEVAFSVLNPTLATIDAIASTRQLQDYLVEQASNGVSAFFGFRVSPDLKNSKKMAAYLSSGGLGLPEREYYLKTDDKSKETRAKYLLHVAKMLVLIAGQSPEEAKQSAERIMQLETQLAKATLTKEEKGKNFEIQYNKMLISQLKDLVPSMDWPTYFQKLGVKEDTIIVGDLTFMRACQKIFESGKWLDIRLYLKWAAIDDAAAYLNHAAVKQNFDFYSKYLQGIDQMKPRWERVLVLTNDFLGEAMGQIYVAKVFPEEAKRKAQEMVENIKLAMGNRIKKLDWMSDSTKIKALAKLASLVVKIGYPDKWKTYDNLIVGKTSYYQNIKNASRFLLQQHVDKLGKPVDKKEWFMSPQTVNAYYNPLFNEIVFPAGILQPPFYNYKADAAVNYGGIGMVIGHEISHGFDDGGSQFDVEGNLKNWWQEEDLEKFTEKGKKLIKQFDAYEPLPGVFVQGEFTLGENIGDLCGINVSYDALQRFLRENGRPDKIDGYTPEQRFFLSLATIWRSKVKDEMLRTKINTDVHSPPIYRVNGPVSNMDQFYEAFNLQEGDTLYRPEEDRIKIW